MPRVVSTCFSSSTISKSLQIGLIKAKTELEVIRTYFPELGELGDPEVERLEFFKEMERVH